LKFPQPHTLKQIANLIDCEFVGSEDFEVLGINEIHVVEPGDIVFVDHPKYYDKAIGNNVTIGKNCIIHSNVSIYDDAIIGNNVTIHAGTILGASAFYYKNRPEGYDQLKSYSRLCGCRR